MSLLLKLVSYMHGNTLGRAHGEWLMTRVTTGTTTAPITKAMPRRPEEPDVGALVVEVTYADEESFEMIPRLAESL